MYTLVKNDEDFFSIFPDATDKDLPMGYPCAISLENRYEFIYVPANVKDFDSFLAGLNARVGKVDKR